MNDDDWMEGYLPAFAMEPAAINASVTLVSILQVQQLPARQLSWKFGWPRRNVFAR